MASPPADKVPTQRPLPRPTRLPLYLALAYLVLIGYASLYPFANWRDLGVPPLEFLDADWPRYWTFFDLAVNVVALTHRVGGAGVGGKLGRRRRDHQFRHLDFLASWACNAPVNARPVPDQSFSFSPWRRAACSSLIFCSWRWSW